MNILHHKSWHVRTKENIARVRRDEAKAAQDERVRNEKIKLSEREARTNFLKSRAKARVNADDNFIPIDSSEPPKTHLNFFQEVEDGTAEYKQTNKEHEKEKKEEKEKYEKQIGYLTYLGQDTNEALGKKSWYNELPKRKPSKNEGEINSKSKELYDPLIFIKKSILPKKDDKKKAELIPKKSIDDYLKRREQLRNLDLTLDKKKSQKRKRDRSSSESSGESRKKKHKHKKKKHKKKKKRRKESSDDGVSEDDDEYKKAKEDKLKLLRLERLKREKDERDKTNSLISKLKGEKPKVVEGDFNLKRKYNSQFNPEIARQNYSPPLSTKR